MDLLDLTPGSRVALLVPGSVAYAELVIALLRRGVFPVPMDVKLTLSEREALLADLDPALVITSPEALEDLHQRLVGPGQGRHSDARSTSRAAPRDGPRASSPGCSSRRRPRHCSPRSATSGASRRTT